MNKIYIIWMTLFIILIIDAKRPNFRKDYRFEKAFNAFYKLHSAAVNWYQARIRCEAEGTELLVPETLDEADTMVLLIASILSKYVGVYIGIHDLYSERSFVTIKGNILHNTLLELLWGHKEPKHSGGRCVAMRRNGKLGMHPCSDPLPFICRIAASNVHYFPECNTYDERWKLGPNSTCYLTHIEQQTWHEAHATCFSAGEHLAVIISQQEVDYIRDAFKHIDHNNMPRNFAFLGFSDLLQKYHYRTVLGDRLSDIQDWDIQCPVNETENKEDKRCGGVSRKGLLATRACNTSAMFFCEKRIAP